MFDNSFNIYIKLILINYYISGSFSKHFHRSILKIQIQKYLLVFHLLHLILVYYGYSNILSQNNTFKILKTSKINLLIKRLYNI